MSDYNGWTNYETWNFQMNIANDESAYLYWQEQAAELDAEQLAEALESGAYDGLEGVDGGFNRDVISQAITQINFAEIAASLKE